MATIQRDVEGKLEADFLSELLCGRGKRAKECWNSLKIGSSDVLDDFDTFTLWMVLAAV